MKKSERSKGKALLSVHDIAPPYTREIMAILADLKGLSVPAVNLAVVPFFHQKYSWPDEGTLRKAIHSLPGDLRTEIMLHGYYHQRVGSNEVLPCRSRFRSRLQSAGEDEFFKLDTTTAANRIGNGQTALIESFQIKPTGFVPPAWGMTKSLLDVCRRSGLAYTEDHFFVFNTLTGEKVFSPLISFSTRNALRENLALSWARLVPVLAGPRRLMRLVLHPSDYRSPKTRRLALKTVERLGRDYDWCLYREIFQ